MRLIPLNMYVLVHPEEKKMDESRFVVPETSQHECRVGRVVDVSVMCPKEVNPGDLVLFLRVHGNAFGDDIVINWADLLGIIKEDK